MASETPTNWPFALVTNQCSRGYILIWLLGIRLPVSRKCLHCSGRNSEEYSAQRRRLGIAWWQGREEGRGEGGCVWGRGLRTPEDLTCFAVQCVAAVWTLEILAQFYINFATAFSKRNCQLSCRNKTDFCQGNLDVYFGRYFAVYTQEVDCAPHTRI